VSVVALAVALVAVVATVLTTESGNEVVPPRVTLEAAPVSGASDEWRVAIQSVSTTLPLWRFSVLFFIGDTQVDPPVSLVETGNLWIRSSPPGLSLNFTDSDGNGNLTPGDSFLLDNVPSGFYSLRLLWAANQSQIQHATFGA
jgi:hypothetical protein